MTSPFQEALRRELMGAAARGPRPRRWPWAAAVAAVAAALASITLWSASPASADVEVRFKAGRVEVLMTDVTNTPYEVQDALQDAGIDARVSDVPAGPSNVARFLQVQIDGEPIQDLVRIGSDGPAFMGFSIPVGWEGTLEIFLGRPAHGGESYATASDAFAPGEPLHCGGVLGEPLSRTRAELGELAVRIQPLLEGSLTPPLSLTDALRHGYGDWIVVSGAALSEQEVLLQVAEQAASPLEEQRC